MLQVYGIGNITMAEISISIKNKYFWGEQNIIATYTMYQLMHFYVLKMAITITFFGKNAVEAI